MAYTQKIFEEKTFNYYKSLRIYEPFLMLFLSSSDLTDAFRENMIRQRVTEGDRNTIEEYVKEIAQLKKDKDSLEKNKADLAVVQKQVEEKTDFLAGEVAKVEAYLATLTAKQQAFLAAKLESLGISRSAYNLKGGCTDDRNVDPGFPGTRIAFFTFGVPNRVGMNQYGAKGRADDHQTYDQILHAYYNFDGYQNFDTNIQIRVNNGNGINTGTVIWSGSLDEYIKRIYEVPDSWPMEALKAQAIAARSYALAATNKGSSSICANEYCQVFKTNPKGGNWDQAVNVTPGQAMISGGQPIKAWFSATHGGYAFNSGDIGWSPTSWTKRMVDTPSGNAGSFDDLFNNAYDRSSPVFYCDWGARASYNKTAWLKPDELADIVNAVLLVERDGSTKPHLYQTDKPNPEGTDTWTDNQVKQELSKYLIPFNTISDVLIGPDNVDFGTGRTKNVTVSGDAPSQTINGDDFKNYFNLRAPSNIQIVGPLYKVEKR